MICFVDTETTGLDPDRHEIWEVAAIRYNPGTDEVLDAARLWQLPVDLGRADSVALKIGRFHERRLLSGFLTDLVRFARSFAEYTRGAHLAGAVVSFDEERLRRLLRRNGACPEWHYHLVDVEALVAGALKVAPPWKSDDLSSAIGVDPTKFDRHTAMGDCEWALAQYRAVMGRE